MSQKRSRSFKVLIGLALTAVPSGPAARAQERVGGQPGGVIVRDGNGSIGVFSGGATGFIGGTGPNGFQGVYVGPDGRTYRVSPKPGAATVTPPFPVISPDSFDPFAFAFGPSRSPFVAPPRPGWFDREAARRSFRHGDVKSVLRAADEAARWYPEDSEVQQTRALALFALGRFEEAGRAVRRAWMSGDWWDWAAVRAHYNRNDDYLSQLRSLQRAARDPAGSRSADVQLLLGYHNIALGRLVEGREAVVKALRARPEDPVAEDILDRLPPAHDAEGGPP